MLSNNQIWLSFLAKSISWWEVNSVLFRKMFPDPTSYLPKIHWPFTRWYFPLLNLLSSFAMILPGPTSISELDIIESNIIRRSNSAHLQVVGLESPKLRSIFCLGIWSTTKNIRRRVLPIVSFDWASIVLFLIETKLPHLGAFFFVADVFSVHSQ